MPKKDAELFLRLSTTYAMAMTGESGCLHWQEFLIDRGVNRDLLAGLVQAGELSLEEAMARAAAFDRLWAKYKPKSDDGQMTADDQATDG